MFLADLIDLHDLSLSDDTALNELRDAIAVYAEENDLLFTEVCDILKDSAKWTTCYRQSLLQSWLFSTSICEVIMNIIPSFCKLNRLFRRAMDKHYQELPIDGPLSYNEMDDIDNMYAGCAFE